MAVITARQFTIGSRLHLMFIHSVLLRNNLLAPESRLVAIHFPNTDETSVLRPHHPIFVRAGRRTISRVVLNAYCQRTIDDRLAQKP